MTADHTEYVPHVLLVGQRAHTLLQTLRNSVPDASRWRLEGHSEQGALLQLHREARPDLVVLLIDRPDATTAAVFERGKAAWPRTFFMLATDQPRSALQAFVEQHGDLPVVTPDAGALCTAISQEVAGLSRGSFSGLSLPSLLQMMEWEAKSLAIRVQAGPLWGRLHLYKGRLVDAYVHQGPPTGEAAAYEILAWPNGTMTIERSYRNLQHVIEQPLTHLLMEAMRRRDEDHHPEDLSIDDVLLDDLSGTDPAEDDMFRRPRRSAREPTPPTPEANPQPSPLISAEVTSAIKEHTDMANAKETLDAALQTIDGAAAAALVDYSSGMALGTAGSGVNLEVAAAGNTEVVRAKLRTMDALGIKGGIEDILITLEKQYHIIYLIPGQTLFLYLVLNRDQANLAMARYKLKALGSDIKI